MRLIESINAITSWENYEYQGHVALYIAIKNILDLLQQDKSISGYDLQIEGEEDFSLRKDAKYISNFDDCVSYLKENVKENDIVLTLGAGTVTKIGPMLLK